MASKLLFFCFILISFVHGNGNLPPDSTKYFDDCSSNISNLWLDVVVVIDGSSNTSPNTFAKIIANLMASFLGHIQFGSGSNHSTRVGLITYDTNFTILADLDKCQSLDDFYDIYSNSFFGKIGTDSNSYMAQGLIGAHKVLQHGRQNEKRNNYKQVIVVFTETFSDIGNPVRISEILKSGDISIVIWGFGSDTNYRQQYEKVASPSGVIMFTDLNTVDEFRSLLSQFNCYCRSEWKQYTTYDKQNNKYRQSTCFKYSIVSYSGQSAKLACQNYIQNGHLVSEFSQEKHDFIYNWIIHDGYRNNTQYHIGISYINNNWYWDQGNDGPSLLVDNNLWIGGISPKPTTSMSVISSQKGWSLTGNQALAIAICEINSCDSDNYCS